MTNTNKHQQNDAAPAQYSDLVSDGGMDPRCKKEPCAPAPAADLYDLLARVTDKLEALSCAFRDELGESGEAEELELCDAAGALIDEARATLATQGAK